MKYLFILLTIPSISYGQETQGNVEANVVAPAIMREDGSIPPASSQPIYCENNICYF
jgi:hypothetical protein